jgi:ankyrin repeat protein
MQSRKLITMSGLVAALSLEAFAGAVRGGGDVNTRLMNALRAGDMAAVRTLAQRANPNLANSAGETPLMAAATYSTPEAVRLLLGRGADPNVKSPTGTTALMLATGDAAKVKALLDKGAQANARSVTGRTALLIAASRGRSGAVVKLLLAAGADPNAKDQLQGPPTLPIGTGGSTPLIEAAKIDDGEALEALLAAGGRVDAKDNGGADALAAAALAGHLRNVRRLIAAGAGVNALVTANRFTPLMYATWRQDPELVSTLLKAGADPNAQDALGDSVLMWSAFSDYADPECTRLLIEAGAKVDTRNQAGESAMSWARRRGETAVVRLLAEHGAVPSEAATAKQAPARPEAQAHSKTPEQSVAKALALLQASGPTFFKVSGCISCHNQSLPQMVVMSARSRGIHVDEEQVIRTRAQILSTLKPARLPFLEIADVVPDVPGSVPYVLLGMAAEGYQPDEITDAAVIALAAKQNSDGSWRPWAPRPPIEFSAVTSTALIVRSLRAFAPGGLKAEMEQRIARAGEWLRTVHPRTNEERVMRLLGLQAVGARAGEIASAAQAVAAAQNPDGGWSQLDALSSDAYATGQALYALRTAGGVAAADPAYRRGAGYLLRTQEEDGSWRVVTRSFPFQPYNESGFPHGNDQWISAAGTAWAALALSQDAPAPVLALR